MKSYAYELPEDFDDEDIDDDGAFDVEDEKKYGHFFEAKDTEDAGDDDGDTMFEGGMMLSDMIGDDEPAPVPKGKQKRVEYIGEEGGESEEFDMEDEGDEGDEEEENEDLSDDAEELNDEAYAAIKAAYGFGEKPTQATEDSEEDDMEQFLEGEFNAPVTKGEKALTLEDLMGQSQSADVKKQLSVLRKDKATKVRTLTTL
jgi:U3 small nucleolar RNA-associated protein 14